MVDNKAVTKGTNPDGSANQSVGQDEVFRSVGKHVEAMNLAEADENEESDDEGPKIVDEIESLCMNCEENVWYPPVKRVHQKLQILTSCHGLGHHTTPAHKSAVLPRDHLNIILLSSLPF